MSLLSSIAGGLISGAGSAIGGYLGAKAAKDAAKLQLKAQREAIAETRKNADTAVGYLKPGTDLYAPALSKLTSLSGLGGRAAQEAAYADYVESPGVAFLRDRGMQGIERRDAGKGRTGRTLLDLSRFNQGLATTDFGNYYGRIAGIADHGYSATQGAVNARTGASSRIADITMRSGDTAAEGRIGGTNAVVGGLQGVADSLAYSIGGLKKPTDFSGGGSSSYSRLPNIAYRDPRSGLIGGGV